GGGVWGGGGVSGGGGGAGRGGGGPVGLGGGTGGGPEQPGLEREPLRHFLRRAQMAEVDRVEGAAEHADPRHSRSWPSPRRMYFCAVSPSSPIGPNACSFEVEIPISAPSPSRKPSANAVEQLTPTVDEFTRLSHACELA